MESGAGQSGLIVHTGAIPWQRVGSRTRGRSAETNITIKSSETMRIPIPNNPDQLIKLALAIVAKHKAMGQDSPLNGIEDIAHFEPQATAADAANTDAKDFAQKSEQATEARDNALGKNTTTPGTLRFFVTASRDMLAAANKGSKHKLGDWGFLVDATAQASAKAAPAAKAKPAA